MSGAIFRGARDGLRMPGKAAVARVQRLAAPCGLDVARIGALNLRSGLTT